MRYRTIQKAVSWEVSSNVVCFGIALGVFGNLGSCLVFTVACISLKLIMYYYHEMLWEGRQ